MSVTTPTRQTPPSDGSPSVAPGESAPTRPSRRARFLALVVVLGVAALAAYILVPLTVERPILGWGSVFDMTSDDVEFVDFHAIGGDSAIVAVDTPRGEVTLLASIHNQGRAGVAIESVGWEGPCPWIQQDAVIGPPQGTYDGTWVPIDGYVVAPGEQATLKIVGEMTEACRTGGSVVSTSTIPVTVSAGWYTTTVLVDLPETLARTDRTSADLRSSFGFTDR